MNQQSLFKQITLYRFRYVVGGIALLLLLVSLLISVPTIAPIGISPAVIDSVIISGNLSFTSIDTAQLINLPYHALQALSLMLLGASWWGITLPSIVMAFVSGVLFVLMIKHWFRLDIAILSGLLLVTSAPFLTLGRSGFSMIMVVFWLSLILLASTKILHGAKAYTFWQFTAIIAAGLSLYSPLMIYPLIALTIAGILHPHVRYLVRKAQTWKLILGGVLFFAITSPLIIQLILRPDLITTLLGISLPLSLDSVLANAIQSIKTVFGVQSAVISDVPKPFFIAPILIIAALGLVKTIIDHHSARAYLLGIWIVLLAIPVLFQAMNLYAIIIPIMILVAIGLETIIREWYKLFPNNPYARIGGLIPLTVLLAVMTTSGIYQYVYGHAYADRGTEYHQALSPTRDTIYNNEQASLIVTSQSLEPFYQIVAREYDNVDVQTTVPSPDNRPPLMIVHDDHEDTLSDNPTKIITSFDRTDNVLVRIYEQD